MSSSKLHAGIRSKRHPAAVMPNSLSRAFAHAREYGVLENEYRNGESQRSLLVATSRKRWRLAKRLTPALPTSTATQGRYTIRFEGSSEQSVRIGRADVEIEVVELA